MNIIRNNLIVNTIIPHEKPQTKQSTERQEEAGSFSQIFANELDGRGRVQPIQFSKHAESRLISRDINLSSEQLSRIESGVCRAREKGIKDSLVLVDDVALLVNIRSNIVITAVDKQNENVFTKIDGAVIV